MLITTNTQQQLIQQTAIIRNNKTDRFNISRNLVKCQLNKLAHEHRGIPVEIYHKFVIYWE